MNESLPRHIFKWCKWHQFLLQFALLPPAPSLFYGRSSIILIMEPYLNNNRGNSIFFAYLDLVFVSARSPAALDS